MSDPAVAAAIAQLIAAIATVTLLIGTAIAKRIQDRTDHEEHGRHERDEDRDDA